MRPEESAAILSLARLYAAKANLMQGGGGMAEDLAGFMQDSIDLLSQRYPRAAEAARFRLEEEEGKEAKGPQGF